MARKNEGSDTAVATKPRPSALVGALDFGSQLDPATIPATVRTSQFDARLKELYAATEAGKVSRAQDGGFNYVAIGHYGTQTGSRAQRKVLEARLGGTYEFKVTSTGDGGSTLWARVRVVAD